MANNKEKTTKIVLLGLLTAVLLVMSYTPLGYLHLGAIEITFNVIPVAVAAIALGKTGAVTVGAVFGLTSFLQCVQGTSPFGATLLGINPVLTFILCVIPRVLMGLIAGAIHKPVMNKIGRKAACFVTGFVTAFSNTLFFISALIILFGRTEYIQSLMAGKNVVLFALAFAGVNAVFEMIASTLVTGAVGNALYRARAIK